MDNTDSVVTEVRQALAAELRAQRARRRISQADLGARAGMSKQVVFRLESGMRSFSFEQVVLLAAALDMDWLQFLANVHKSMQEDTLTTT